LGFEVGPDGHRDRTAFLFLRDVDKSSSSGGLTLHAVFFFISVLSYKLKTATLSIGFCSIHRAASDAKEAQFLKDPSMLKRFQEKDELEEKEKECIYSLLEAYIAKNRLQAFLK
jgi:hypothetical protein